MQIGSRRLQHAGKDRHITLSLFALGGQRSARVMIRLRQIAIQHLARECQFLQTGGIQPRQRARCLNHQFPEPRTSPAFSKLLQSNLPLRSRRPVSAWLDSSPHHS